MKFCPTTNYSILYTFLLQKIICEILQIVTAGVGIHFFSKVIPIMGHYLRVVT
jgi:hypothetical protein